MDDREANRAAIRRLFEEVLNADDDAALGEILSAEYVEHDPVPGQAPGPRGVRGRLDLLRAAFPDIRFTLEDTLAQGDRVVARWTMTGTHRGPFLTVPATGRTVTSSGIDFYRLEGGRIVEHWHEMDLLGLLQQLGVATGRS